MVCSVHSVGAHVTILRKKICICQKYNCQDMKASVSYELETAKNSGRDGEQRWQRWRTKREKSHP